MEEKEKKKDNKVKQFFHKLFVTENEDNPSIVLKIYQKKATKSILASLISIGIGLLVGLLIMIGIAIFKEDVTIAKAFKGLGLLIKGPFASKSSKYWLTNMGNSIFYAVPLIFTGLSVGIAFKTGLFNIGAPGQYVMGTIGALLVGLYIKTNTAFSGFLVWLLALLTGALFGMLWGIIPGLLKAFFKINEVIICIMTNWIAANIATWVFENCPSIINPGNTKSSYLITTAATGNGTPTLGLDKLFTGSYIDIGIIIAIVIAIVIYLILEKTILGYELKACGFNRNAAKYAGLNEKRNIILSMAIAGALAGIGASLYFLNPGIEYKFTAQYLILPSYGFNGIASAFLANCNPIGTIFSSLFMRHITMGGEYLTSVGLDRNIAEIIISVIIYVAGLSRIIREFLSKRENNKSKNKLTVDKVDKEAKNG